MSNLFKYATSELSQDAFLCWLLSGVSLETNQLFKKHKNEQTYRIARKILFEFLQLEDKGQEVDVSWVQKQWNRHLDIVIDYKIDDEIYILGIEDKTKSTIHLVRGKDGKNQIQEYRKELEDYWNNESKKKKGPRRAKQITTIVYKTAYFTDYEKEIISKTDKNEWSFYDIENIIDIFFEASGNEEIESDIISNYLERLSIVRENKKDDSNVFIWDVWTDDIFDACWEKLALDTSHELNKRGLKVETSYYRGTYLECWFGIEGDVWACLTPRDWIKDGKRRLYFRLYKTDVFNHKEETKKYINNLKNLNKYTGNSRYIVKLADKKLKMVETLEDNQNLGTMVSIKKEVVINPKHNLKRSDLLKTLIETVVEIFDCLEGKKKI